MRSRDGLALSSRSDRLSEAQQAQACVICQSLRAAAADTAGGLQTGYVRCVAEGSPDEVVEPTEKESVLLVAATLAGVRLIDCVAGPGRG